MKIYFENVGFLQKRLIQKIFDRALEKTENAVEDVSVSVKFVSEEEIKSLNNEFRKIDKVTDVLSFPMLEIKEPQKLSEFSSEREADGSLNLGDIAICTKRAKEQAKEFENSYKRELAFLALHGLLHVLGYDHIEKDDEKKMMSFAEEILSEFNIGRGKHV